MISFSNRFISKLELLSSESQTESNDSTRCAKGIGTIPGKLDLLIVLASLLGKLLRVFGLPLLISVISWVLCRIVVIAVTIAVAVHFVLIVLTSTVILFMLIASAFMVTRSFASLIFLVRVFDIRSVSVSVLVVTVIRVPGVTIGSVRSVGIV